MSQIDISHSKKYYMNILFRVKFIENKFELLVPNIYSPDEAENAKYLIMKYDSSSTLKIFPTFIKTDRGWFANGRAPYIISLHETYENAFDVFKGLIDSGHRMAMKKEYQNEDSEHDDEHKNNKNNKNNEMDIYRLAPGATEWV